MGAPSCFWMHVATQNMQDRRHKDTWLSYGQASTQHFLCHHYRPQTYFFLADSRYIRGGTDHHFCGLGVHPRKVSTHHPLAYADIFRQRPTDASSQCQVAYSQSHGWNNVRRDSDSAWCAGSPDWSTRTAVSRRQPGWSCPFPTPCTNHFAMNELRVDVHSVLHTRLEEYPKSPRSSSRFIRYLPSSARYYCCPAFLSSPL